MDSQSIRFVAGGGMRIDYLVTHDGAARCGIPGGNALYSAVGAAIWSRNVGIWARLGANYPDSWLAELNRYCINRSGLIRLPGEHDHRTFYAYLPDGQRDDTHPADHFVRIGMELPPELLDYIDSTPGQAELEELDPLALRVGDWPAAYKSVTAVHLAPMPLHSHLELASNLRQAGIKQITLDPGERYMIPQRATILRELLPFLSAFLPSDQEVRTLFGPGITLEKAAFTLAEWGAKLVVIKMGPAGVLIYDKSGGMPIRLPAFHEAGDPGVVDVTGAGDAFCGGFMVGLANNLGDSWLAAQVGLVSASLVIEGYGALYALDHNNHEAITRLQLLCDRARRSRNERLA